MPTARNTSARETPRRRKKGGGVQIHSSQGICVSSGLPTYYLQTPLGAPETIDRNDAKLCGGVPKPSTLHEPSIVSAQQFWVGPGFAAAIAVPQDSFYVAARMPMCACITRHQIAQQPFFAVSAHFCVSSNFSLVWPSSPPEKVVHFFSGNEKTQTQLLVLYMGYVARAQTTGRAIRGTIRSEQDLRYTQKTIYLPIFTNNIWSYLLWSLV